MKTTFGTPFLITMSLALSPLASRASVPFADGNLAAVFYSAAGTGQTLTLGSQYFVFNLGPAYLYRENTQNDVSVSTVNPTIASSNIATDLAAQFGPTWATDGTVRMFVTTTLPVQTSGNALQGDTDKALYFSVPRTSLDNGQTGAGVTFPTFTGTSLFNTCVGQIRPFLYDATNFAIAQTNGYTNSNPTVAPFGNAAGVRLPMTGNTINLGQYIPPATNNLYFALGTNPAAILSTTALAGSAGVKGAVSMYRALYSLTDVNGAAADLTSGSSSTNAAVRTAQYIGSLSLDGTGLLKIQSAGLAAAANYSTWATTNGVTGQAANLDHDNDGVSNGVEYFIGGPTGNTTGFTPQPGLTTSGNTRSVTWTKAATYTGVYNTDFVVETSTTLAAGSWVSETLGVNVVISGNNVTYTFPTGPVKTFARLKVTGP